MFSRISNRGFALKLTSAVLLMVLILIAQVPAASLVSLAFGIALGSTLVFLAFRKYTREVTEGK